MSNSNDTLRFGERQEGTMAKPASRPRRFGPPGPPGSQMPGDKPRDFRGTALRMFSYLGQFKGMLVLAVIFAALSCLFSVVGPKVLSGATTEVFEGVTAKVAGTGGIDFAAVGRILLITLGVYLLSSALQFVQGWVMATVSQRTCYRLRRDIAAKVDRMPMGYFERTATGDVLSRITNDVDTLGTSLSQGVTQLVTSAVTVVGVLVMMLTISPLMTLVTLVILPVSAALSMAVMKHSQPYFRRQQETLGKINAQVEETFSGQTVVRAFNAEGRTVAAFNDTNARLYESAWKSQAISGLMMPLMNLVSNAGYVVVAVLGGLLAARGSITVGDIQAFVQYVKNFTQPITQLTQVMNVLQQMAAAAERVFDFLEEPEEQRVSARTSSADVRKARVDFDHVSFGYTPDTPVIHDFSAHVPAGSTVALVGPTGAGKTTMVKLLMRFYDVNGGSIRVDGHDVREFDPDDLRSLFGMVLQDTWLFKGTIRENIRYGRLDATDEEVEAAARAAFAHHFIMTLPEGYDTQINEDASNVSAGQRQLLTIARAILADRRMLILDEATSSVDTRTEERIQAAMDNLMAGRTSFVIAHRLSTIRDADLILVMRDGDIVEQGTHDELLAAGGAYAELYRSQFAEV